EDNLMAINRVDITVVNIANLTQQICSELQDGCLAWCVQEGAMFVLVKNAGNTLPDGSTIVAPISGAPSAGNAGARWLRLNAFDGEEFAQQGIWWVDPVNGNDSNDGLTLATALQTYQQIRFRVGSNQINQLTTINLANDFPTTSPVIIDHTLGPNGFLYYPEVKTLTTLYANTTVGFTATTAINRATNSPTTVTDPLVPTSWTAAGLINTQSSTPRRIRLTSGTNSGAIAWAYEDAGASTAVTSPFLKALSTIPSGSPTVITPAIGDQFIVETGFVQMPNFYMNPVLPSIQAGSNPGFSERVQLDGVDLAGWVSVNNRPLISNNQQWPASAPPILFWKSDVGRACPGNDSDF